MELLYTKYKETLRYRVLLGLCCLLMVASVVAFAVNYSRNGVSLFASIDLFLFILYIFCFFSIRKQGLRSWNKALVAYSYILVILLLTTIGNLSGGLLNWVFTMPLMIYILYSRKQAFITSLAVLIYEVINVYFADTYGKAESFVGVPNFFLSYSLIWLLADIYERQNSEIKQKILVHAIKDPLTGAYNRLPLKQNIESHNHKKPMSICLLDIDLFKQVNDSYGHDIGDQVLIRLVEILTTKTSSIQVYRLGGEEFAILFNDELSIAVTKAKEILATVNASNYKDIHHELTLGFSAGVATLLTSESMADVLKRADYYLYQAKNSGRNKIMSELCKTG